MLSLSPLVCVYMEEGRKFACLNIFDIISPLRQQNEREREAIFFSNVFYLLILFSSSSISTHIFPCLCLSIYSFSLLSLSPSLSRSLSLKSISFWCYQHNKPKLYSLFFHFHSFSHQAMPLSLPDIHIYTISIHLFCILSL